MKKHNITLIGSLHEEIGKCNSDELYKIIVSINPDVVFEELSSDLFDRFYGENPLPEEPSEVKCIKKYLQGHNIKHIPVDIGKNPNLSDDELRYMWDTFQKYDVYKKISVERNSLMEQYGFAYLNSDKCLKSFEKEKTTEKSLIESNINKDMLLRISRLFYEEQDNRENEMLRNIYNYSKENQYEQAIFLIGSAHRGSIMQKIKKYKAEKRLKLNWTFYRRSKLLTLFK